MLHGGQHSPIRAAALMLVACGALALGACSSDELKLPDMKMSEISMPDIQMSDVTGSLTRIPKPGVLFDKTPPAVAVVRDGPSGELLNGPAPPLMPDQVIDAIIAEPLLHWLNPLERRRLAEASQRAAAEATLQPVAWEVLDDSGRKIAIGTAMSVDNAYRAVRGGICRDLRQSLIKKDEAHQSQVTLCRQDYGSGLWVWVTGLAEQQTLVPLARR
jgi:surface antigen